MWPKWLIVLPLLAAACASPGQPVRCPGADHGYERPVSRGFPGHELD